MNKWKSEIIIRHIEKELVKNANCLQVARITGEQYYIVRKVKARLLEDKNKKVEKEIDFSFLEDVQKYHKEYESNQNMEQHNKLLYKLPLYINNGRKEAYQEYLNKRYGSKNNR